MSSSSVRADSLVIAVLTYQRPDDLPDLLPELQRQALAHAPDSRVLVIDNDAAASARGVVEALHLPAVRYVVEPTPGIAAARNRALAESSDRRLLVFIDDDERPEAQWLDALVSCYERYDRPAAVAGAVIPDVGLIDDPWIEAGRFFVRPRHETGATQSAASTANLLLDLDQIRARGLTFDAAFGISGGSDTLFTRHLTSLGGRIVWCDEGRVVDHIRPQRLTRAWVLQRHFRAGNGTSRVALHLASGPAQRIGQRLALTGKGLVRIVGGGARSAFGLVSRSLWHQARGRRTMARGWGMTKGAWGSVYVEYTRDESGATAGG